VKLLFVANYGPCSARVHLMKWRPRMRLLFISELNQYARAINTIAKYAHYAKELGHEVAVFGEQRSEAPIIECSLNVKEYDFAIFIIYNTADFPDLPYLAQLLDSMPKERRILIDCTGRYNDTIRVEHDFNHLEKIDGHQGWEWLEGFEAIASKILQPTLRPLRSNTQPFLFHAFDPSAVACPYASPHEAANAWSTKAVNHNSYGIIYVGNNWQRWSQLERLFRDAASVRDKIGASCLTGWNWDKRPDWAAELGFYGMDVDPDLLDSLGVERKPGIPFQDVVAFQGQALFCPIIHRPLFNKLGIVTNRSFETFCSNTVPLLFLPIKLAMDIYGPDAVPLIPGEDLGAHLEDVIKRPAFYWTHILKVRQYLSEHHSFQRRYTELQSILEA
jgi:hypothetical protein